eukprot:CAMPEP_0172478576 /NCGR_PEP_ID=MMETSP1066-20121228/2597_1 /TAXON_ID=671091 /ORGANISM="Coscinodiscus wailesii, Strain CCMP2513" /LENGTH=80 /DNA_ID=CAMNT_0013238263 /DNA_START=48 /DNA_END=286 /DNA_ORIENTATION=+
MSNIIIILFAICGAVIAANKSGGHDVLRPISEDRLSHEVVGGGGCYSFKVYEDSGCTGEVDYEYNQTVGASIEDGCEDYG